MVEKFLETIRQYPEPYIHYAHNAQYDWRYILPYLAENKIPCEICMRTESDIYEIRILDPDGDIIMRDSFAIFDFKLADFAKAYCPELLKLQIDVENFNPDNLEHETYARRDSQILAVGLPRMNAKYMRHFGISVGPTIASTAIRAWQESLGENVIYECMENKELETFCREGYYGGLVFLTRNDAIHSNDGIAAITFDIGSSYPAAMCKYGVPYGGVMSSRDYCEGKPGMYRVRVRTPEDLIIPILASRNVKGHMQWRRGEFETVVTSQELIFAAKQGYEILDILEGIVWEKLVFPFNDVIELCKEIRKKYKGLPEEFIAKKIQNSIYGKFGSRRERARIFIPGVDDEEIDDSSYPLEACDYFWIKTEVSDRMKCNPHWAAFITANARLRLLQTAYAVGPENCIYGDTDSLTILPGFEELIDIGDEYGQFKLEKIWAEFRAIAPKVYAGRLFSGDWKGAAKGLPRKNLKTENWREILETGVTSARALSLGSLKAGLKKGMREAKELERVSSDIRNSSNWELHENLVRPKIA